MGKKIIFSDFSKFFQLLEIIENNNKIIIIVKIEKKNCAEKKNLEWAIAHLYCNKKICIAGIVQV